MRLHQPLTDDYAALFATVFKRLAALFVALVTLAIVIIQQGVNPW